MDPKKAADLAGRLRKAGPKGVGAGLGIFALAGGIYGLTQSVYTGMEQQTTQVIVAFVMKRNVYITLAS